MTMKKIKHVSFLSVFLLFFVCTISAASVGRVSALAGTSEEGATLAATISLDGDISDSITEDISERTYTLNVTSAGRLTLDITSYMQYYCIYIYDSAGSELWYTNWNEWNSDVKFRSDEYELDLSAGTHYLKVTGYKFGDSCKSTGRYEISTSFKSAGENVSEPNDDFSTATTITANSTIKGQISLSDDKDVFKIKLSKAGALKLDMTSYMQYYCILLYDSAGNELWYTNWNEWNSNVKYRKDSYKLDLASGTYYVVVNGYKFGDSCKSTGNYTMKTEFVDAGVNYTEPNNDFSTAYSLGTEKTVKGQLALNDEYDMFKFSIGTSREITLKMKSYMEKYNFTIYDSDGKDVWSSGEQGLSDTQQYRADTYKVSLSAGSYYLKVDGSTGNYTLTYTSKVQLTSANVKLSTSSCTYNGKVRNPSVIVKNNSGKKLVKGRDYTVTVPSGRKNVGKYVYKITFKGNYYGSVTKAFVIKPAPTKITAISSQKNGVKIKWKKSGCASGYVIYRSANGGKYKKIKTITSPKTVTFTDTKAKVKGTKYTYKIVVYRKASGTTYKSVDSTAKAIRRK
jgi:hypothetical protein